MKQIIMITCMLASGIAAFAQKDHRVYKFDHAAQAKDVHRYGEAPEFPFLRDLNSKEQFVAAMHRPMGKSTAEMNGILKGIGFAHGAKDVSVANVAPAYIPEGTVGNMGDAGHNYLYAKLYADGGGVKAWKVTADNGASVYFISKCGNAFYADPMANGPASAAAKTDDDFKGMMPVVAARPVCKDKVYIYYGGTKKIHRGWEVFADDMDVERCSEPEDKSAKLRAEEEPAKAYTAISAERTSVYLGYKPVHSEKCVRYYRGGLREHKMSRRMCSCRE